MAKAAEIAENLTQLQAILDRAEHLTAQLDDETLNRQPDEKSWSVGQCLDHLNVTAKLYLRDLPGAIERARQAGVWGDHPPKRGIIGRLFIYVLEPPPKLRVKAPKDFLPAASVRKEDLMREYRELREKLRVLMQASAGLDLWKVKMPLPTIKQVRLSLGEIFHVLLAHERRHLWQAENVKANFTESEPQA